MTRPNVEYLYNEIRSVPIELVNGTIKEHEDKSYSTGDDEKPTIWCIVCDAGIEKEEINFHNHVSHQKYTSFKTS